MTVALRTALPVGAAVLALGVLLLSYSGAWFAPGDSLAVGRPNLCAVLLLLALWLWRVHRARWALICALAGTLSAAGMVLHILPGTVTAGPLTLYQKNLLAKAWPRYPLTDEIIASGADFVTLQEVSPHNQRYMKRLFEAYPAQLICPFRKNFNVAVLTRHTPVPGTSTCQPGDGLALMQVQLPDGQRLWIASLHLFWPWPYSQFEQLKRILPRLQNLEGPVVLAGDFNMVAWGASVARIAAATKTQRAGRAYDTYPHFQPLLTLPIDHVLLPQGSSARIQLRDFHGSDHRGLLAQFTLY